VEKIIKKYLKIFKNPTSRLFS